MFIFLLTTNWHTRIPCKRLLAKWLSSTVERDYFFSNQSWWIMCCLILYVTIRCRALFQQKSFFFFSNININIRISMAHDFKSQQLICSIFLVLLWVYVAISLRFSLLIFLRLSVFLRFSPFFFYFFFFLVIETCQ